MSSNETIAAIATPPGRGGIGIVRISGPRASSVARQLAPQLHELKARHAHFSRWLDEKGEQIDAGLSLYFPAPHSYTGEDVLELHSHGNPVVLHALLERVLALGCRSAEPGEFTRRAVENGKMDLSQAEAVAACIDAATLRAARQAQRHLQGEFGRHIDSLMQAITGVVAHVEACLDFPEEEVPVLLFEQLRDEIEQHVLAPIRQSLSTAGFGERLFDGVSVAIIGPPNVGKSSLLNCLAGHDRAIVSDIPGTTRDVLEVDFEVQGIPARLVDTAGMRATTDFIEEEGVRRARKAAAAADIVIYVADAARPDTWQPDDTIDLLLLNKIDLLPDASAIPEGYLGVCALTGAGVNSMLEVLAARLGAMPAAEEGILVTRQRHHQALERAAVHIEKGLALLGREDQLELVALEWRQAWSVLGEILGIG
ncbi:MAG: tRNA uridine-5-carboxymethylaminomethyl(34) synthesis GTPase MnmE, partial [Mariprofundaceae bacterium]|nr:tRNA uridine-5-carboxymethylaminomethyl(34) synthesis GTPase MnmE [Mariprofundaceae bacterium]